MSDGKDLLGLICTRGGLQIHHGFFTGGIIWAGTSIIHVVRSHGGGSLSHPVLTDKTKCGLCVPRKFNTHKDVIGEVTKAILLLIIVKLLHKVFT